MKIVTDFEKARDSKSAQFHNDWHREYPSGIIVAPYCNDDVPGMIFDGGADWSRNFTLNEIKNLIESYGEPYVYVPDLIKEIERKFLGEQNGGK